MTEMIVLTEHQTRDTQTIKKNLKNEICLNYVDLNCK